MKKFKTIHENKVLINPPTECVEFDGNLILPEQQPTLIEVLNNLRNYILSLQRYECNSNSGGQDCWCTMDEDKEGEYVKLEDIIKLFGAEK